jgi:hypothetical protein
MKASGGNQRLGQHQCFKPHPTFDRLATDRASGHPAPASSVQCRQHQCPTGGQRPRQHTAPYGGQRQRARDQDEPRSSGKATHRKAAHTSRAMQCEATPRETGMALAVGSYPAAFSWGPSRRGRSGVRRRPAFNDRATILLRVQPNGFSFRNRFSYFLWNDLRESFLISICDRVHDELCFHGRGFIDIFAFNNFLKFG